MKTAYFETKLMYDAMNKNKIEKEIGRVRRNRRKREEEGENL